MNFTSAASIDASTALGLSLGSVALAVVLYVWTALALAAVFRKSGLPGWQAWVPILNIVVLLQLGALSGWLVLLILVPVLGQLALWVCLVLACYRVNLSFGFGAGMTVLAAVSLPVWASVIGFGPARWLGEPAHAAAPAGPRRSADGPFAGASAAPPREGGTDLLAERLGVAGSRGAGSAAPQPSSVQSFAPAAAPAPTPAAAGSDSGASAAAAPVSSVPLTSVPARVSGRVPMPEIPPAPPLPSPVPATPLVAEADNGGFDLGAVGELTSGATDAVPGAPPPISAASARSAQPPISDISEITGQSEPSPPPVSAVRPASSVPPVSSVPLSSFVPASESSMGWTTPPVTRVPAAAPTPPAEEPWAPRRSAAEAPDPSAAFPESSAEVSAIAGAPDAGSPRSARRSVSAQHTKPEIPDEPLDHTIITRRKRTAWSLVPPAGAPVPLSAQVVILGRKPSPDDAFPGAQLVPVDDGTVSKTHARLALREDRWYITDLGSTNGVLFATLMGTEIEATPGVEVEAGERFFLGDAEVRLQRSDG